MLVSVKLVIISSKSLSSAAVICEDLTLTNGMVMYSDPTIPRAVSSTANYSCDIGYNLTGVSVRTCAGGGWDGTAPTCTRKLV